MKLAQLGIVGLGVMGANLAAMPASKGYAAAVYERDQGLREAFLQKSPEFPVAAELEELPALVGRPRKILLMVRAGGAGGQRAGQAPPRPGAGRCSHRPGATATGGTPPPGRAGGGGWALVRRSGDLRREPGGAAGALHHARRQPGGLASGKGSAGGPQCQSP